MFSRFPFLFLATHMVHLLAVQCLWHSFHCLLSSLDNFLLAWPPALRCSTVLWKWAPHGTQPCVLIEARHSKTVGKLGRFSFSDLVFDFLPKQPKISPRASKDKQVCDSAQVSPAATSVPCKCPDPVGCGLLAWSSTQTQRRRQRWLQMACAVLLAHTVAPLGLSAGACTGLRRCLFFYNL